MFHVEVLVFVRLAGVIFSSGSDTGYFICTFMYIFYVWTTWTFGETSDDNCRHGRFDLVT